MWLDEHIDTLSDTTLRGDGERKMRTMYSVIYEISKNIFGVKEINVKIQNTTPNRRQLQIQDLRSDLKRPHKRYKEAKEDEKAHIAELT